MLVRGVPSPWSRAAKTILEIKGLDYVAAPLDVGGANAEVAAWSGQNSGPVVAWRDGAPLNRWLDILLLAERLAPTPALLPADPLQRALAIGLSHEIMGEGGIAWNRRLQMFSMAVQAGAGARMAPLIDKYGFDTDDAAAAGSRIASTLRALATQLRAQQARGVPYFVGEALSAVDIYWTAVTEHDAAAPGRAVPDPRLLTTRLHRQRSANRGGARSILVEHRDQNLQSALPRPDGVLE